VKRKMKYRTLVKISLFSIFLMILGAVAFYFKMLERRYLEAIIYGNILVQGSVLFSRMKMRLAKKKNVEIIRYQFMKKSIKEFTNVFSEHIFPTNTRNHSIFKIYWEAINPPRFTLEMMDSNGIILSDINSRVLYININKDKDINMFDAEIKVMPNEKINFQFTKDVNIESFTLKEIYILS